MPQIFGKVAFWRQSRSRKQHGCDSGRCWLLRHQYHFVAKSKGTIFFSLGTLSDPGTLNQSTSVSGQIILKFFRLKGDTHVQAASQVHLQLLCRGTLFLGRNSLIMWCIYNLFLLAGSGFGRKLADFGGFYLPGRLWRGPRL